MFAHYACFYLDDCGCAGGNVITMLYVQLRCGDPLIADRNDYRNAVSGSAPVRQFPGKSCCGNGRMPVGLAEYFYFLLYTFCIQRTDKQWL